MNMKARQIIEVSKLPNGKYVLCLISIAPRSMIYYHKQKEPFMSYRWMREDDWSAFDSIIESLAFEANNADDIKRSVNLSPLVYLKVQSINSGINQICQMNPEIKDLKLKNIAMAVNCEIEYREENFSELKYEDNTQNLSILSNELLVPPLKIDNKSNIYHKVQKISVSPKTDEDLDQQIQSFHIGQQGTNCLPPVSLPATINTSQKTTTTPKSDLNSRVNETKNGSENRIDKRNAQEISEQKSISPAVRQRRPINKPKRFDDFYLQPKRESHAQKTEHSDDESFDEERTPKRGRKSISALKTTITKPTNTPSFQKTQQDAQPSCSRALFRKDKDLKTKGLSKKGSRTNMQQLIEELTPPSPPKVEFLSLHDMTFQQLMSTLNEIRPNLDAIFKQIKDEGYVDRFGGIDHFLVIGLVSDKIKTEMMKKLGELYENDEAPKFGSHFLNVLLPEWILSVFMKRYNMEKDDAIKHLKTQNLQHFRYDN